MTNPSEYQVHSSKTSGLEPQRRLTDLTTVVVPSLMELMRRAHGICPPPVADGRRLEVQVPRQVNGTASLHASDRATQRLMRQNEVARSGVADDRQAVLAALQLELSSADGDTPDDDRREDPSSRTNQ